MSAVDLQDPILDSSGIRSINFFNGRLLTARDLTREQAANREADSRLGQATGDGIAYGLEVAKSNEATNQAPLIYVTAGLAVNRRGQTLRLIGDTEVELVRQPNTATTSKPFTECLPLQSGTYVAGAGVYLLTIAPAQTNEGKAPTNGLDTASVSCNTDATVTTVQFRLIQLDPPITEAELDDEDHLRNLVAYKCFGSAEQRAYVRDMFGAALKTYGLLDGLRPTRLTDCDVPLAVLYWTISGGIVFVDNWSVRRALIHHLISGRHAPYYDETSTRASAAMAFASRLSPYVDERRQSEGFAMLLQFEEQLYALVTSLANPQNFEATEAFGLLPPAGIVPLRNAGHPRGFAHEKFFKNKSFAPPTLISAAKLADLLTESLRYPPINLGGTEFVQLYEVIENKQAQTSATPPQPYVVFASQELPYYSENPRFALLCRTLRETATVYTSLDKNRQLYSTESAGPALTGRLAVMTAVQRVADAATVRHVAACGCGCQLNHEKALETLRALYVAQTNVVTVITADPAAPTTAIEFKNALHSHLEVGVPATPTNKPSFAAALTANNLSAAIEAQVAINGITFGASGGTTTTGNLRVTFRTSDKGRNLVPTIREPFNYTFRVQNRMNRPFDVDLSAGFDDRPTWNEDMSISVNGVTTSSVPLQAFDPSNEANPNTFADVVVSVMAPLSGTLEETGRLRFTASVPSAGKSADDSVELRISDRLENEPDRTIDYAAAMRASRSLSGVPIGGIGVTLTFMVRYHTTEAGAETRNFRLFALIGSPEDIANRYQITFRDRLNNDITETASAAPGVVTPTRKASKPVTLTTDVNLELKIQIVPQPSTGGLPSSAGTSLTLNARIEAVSDSSFGKTTLDPITITAATA